MADIEKTITLLQLLSREEGASIKELEKTLDLSKNRVYENIKLLENAGIEVLKDKAGFRRVRQEELLGLFNLSSEELKIVDKISESIKSVHCIHLKDYLDSKGVKADYKVEPIQLFDRNRRLWCFDTKDYMLKHFKIARIGWVEESNTPSYNKDRHSSPKSDIFGTTGDNKYNVSFLLTHLGMHLMKETYPESFKYIKPYEGRNDKFSYKFEGSVYSFYGVGRFILGISGHVLDIYPKGLLEHVKKEINKAYYIKRPLE